MNCNHNQKHNTSGLPFKIKKRHTLLLAVSCCLERRRGVGTKIEAHVGDGTARSISSSMPQPGLSMCITQARGGNMCL